MEEFVDRFLHRWRVRLIEVISGSGAPVIAPSRKLNMYEFGNSGCCSVSGSAKRSGYIAWSIASNSRQLRTAERPHWRRRRPTWTNGW